MHDTFLDRLWTDHHEQFSADINRGSHRIRRWASRLSINAQLLAAFAAIALSMAGTLAAIGPVDGPIAPQIAAAAFDRDGSPTVRIARA